MPTKATISQTALADWLGVSQQAVWAWLNGVALPSPDYMAMIEQRFGIPMRQWTEDAPAPPYVKKAG